MLYTTLYHFIYYNTLILYYTMLCYAILRCAIQYRTLLHSENLVKIWEHSFFHLPKMVIPCIISSHPIMLQSWDLSLLFPMYFNPNWMGHNSTQRQTGLNWTFFFFFQPFLCETHVREWKSDQNLEHPYQVKVYVCYQTCPLDTVWHAGAVLCHKSTSAHAELMLSRSPVGWSTVSPHHAAVLWILIGCCFVFYNRVADCN